MTALQSLGQGEAERRAWTAAGKAVGCGLLGKNKHERHLPFPYNSRVFPLCGRWERHAFRSPLCCQGTMPPTPRILPDPSLPSPSKAPADFPCPCDVPSAASLSLVDQKPICTFHTRARSRAAHCAFVQRAQVLPLHESRGRLGQNQRRSRMARAERCLNVLPQVVPGF